MKSLPSFARHEYDATRQLMSDIFTPLQAEDTLLVDLIEYDDHHFRVIFQKEFFVLHEDREAPSRSQWNTLKKRLKRHHRKLFVFKDYGSVEQHYYLDFGFLKTERE